MNILQSAVIIATATSPGAGYNAHMPADQYFVLFTSDYPAPAHRTVLPEKSSGKGPLLPISNDDPNKILPFAPVSDSVEALGRLRSFREWKANWDGAGAPAPKQKAIEAATNVLGLLNQALPQTPKVALNAHGEPMFMLVDGDVEVSVTVLSAASLQFYISHGSQDDGGLARFNGNRLPKRLEQALESAGLTSI